MAKNASTDAPAPEEVFGAAAEEQEQTEAEVKETPQPQRNEAPEAPEVLPEMRGICWVDVYETFEDGNGGFRYARWNLTERSTEGAMDAFKNLREKLLPVIKRHESLSLYPVNELPALRREPAQQSGGFGGKAAGSNGSAPKSGLGGNAPAGQQATGDNDVTETGTGELKSLTILPEKDGKQVVEFQVGRFKYPFKEYRGLTVAAELFDPAIGITPAFLSTPATYQASDWAASGFPKLAVDWEKRGKYYNVLKVYPGE